MSGETLDTLGSLCVIVALYMLRKHKPFDTIWEIFKLFIIITLVICTAGMALKAIKGWFK